MSHRATTHIIFDADNDMNYYRLMQAWKANDKIDFDFRNAHDINNLTDRASEDQIKRKLRERFSSTDQAIVLIGAATKNLHKFVRWEQETALDLDIPIIAVNLNGMRDFDSLRCPAIIRDEYVVHVPFSPYIVRHAMDTFPDQFHSRKPGDRGPLAYTKETYKKLGYA